MINYNTRNIWLSQHGYNTYAEYLLSEHWRTFRLKILRARHWKCERCPSTERLEVHHRTYARIGCEKPKDVLVLCRICHEQEHLRLKAKSLGFRLHSRKLSLCCEAPLRLKMITPTKVRKVCSKCGMRDHRMRRKAKLLANAAKSIFRS